MENRILQSAISVNALNINEYEVRRAQVKSRIKKYLTNHPDGSIPLSLKQELRFVKRRLETLRGIQCHLKKELARNVLRAQAKFRKPVAIAA